jgi:cytoskeletal protein CcmA (bactofilin family)
MERGKAVDVYAREFVCTAAGKVQGNLDSETADIKGACKVDGNVTTMLLKIGGSMKVTGNVRAELIRAKGAFKVGGDVFANNLRVAGATKVTGKIESSEEIFVQGVLKCESDIKAARFNLQGAVDVAGTLTSKEFAAELSGRSAIKILESDKIVVKIRNKSNDSELIAKKIIGSEILLEGTVAERVEGNRVTLGRGCQISEVKAKELDVHRDSKVGKRI